MEIGNEIVGVSRDLWRLCITKGALLPSLLHFVLLLLLQNARI